jgi:L-alanine-DL-glutamate epimerase-like enolase superfamily enzyme
MPNTVDETKAVVRAMVDRGFTAIKLGWGPFGRDEALDVALVAAARESAGPDVALMFDIGNGWPDAIHALRMVRRYEEFRPHWVEEPLMPDDAAGYAMLANAVETPIAAGEEDTTLWGFAELIERSQVDIVQPDVTRCGGISELMKIAAYANVQGRTVVPHAWSTGIIKAATLQVIGALPSVPFFEYCVQETALNQQLTVERFPVIDGQTPIPTGPGLGIEVDLDALRQFTVSS